MRLGPMLVAVAGLVLVLWMVFATGAGATPLHWPTPSARLSAGIGLTVELHSASGQDRSLGVGVWW